MNIDIYSTIAGELPKLVEKKEPMCFISYEQFLAYKKEMEDEIKELKKVNDSYRKLSLEVLMVGGIKK